MPHEASLSAFAFEQPSLSFSPFPLFGSLDSRPVPVLPSTPDIKGSTRLLDEFTSIFHSFEAPSMSHSSQEHRKITQ